MTLGQVPRLYVLLELLEVAKCYHRTHQDEQRQAQLQAKDTILASQSPLREVVVFKSSSLSSSDLSIISSVGIA